MSFLKRTNEAKQPCGSRLEHDFLGDVEIPCNMYYGIQTRRAVENFQILGDRKSVV